MLVYLYKKSINVAVFTYYLKVIYMIITVEYGDTLELLSAEYDIPTEKIIADNGIVGNTLVTGQSLIIALPERSIIPLEQTAVSDLADEYSTSEKTIYRNNFILMGKSNVPTGTFTVLEYQNPPNDSRIIGGYAYDFISTRRLDSVINYMTYIMPFTYGFTTDGELISPYDDYILERAKLYGVGVLMHISTLTEEGVFDSNLPGMVFENGKAQQLLIDNIITVVNNKGYDGVDIDFEFLPGSLRENYVSFTRILSDRLHEIGKILVIAVPPKTSDDQRGILVEGIDYSGLGRNADYILNMTYEYGYKFGPPLAISPVNQVRRTLDYTVSRIPHEKILLGIANYGYDWTLPYIRGESDAPSISTVEATEIAKRYGAQISFDETSMAPFFFYTDEQGKRHEVWFEDARSYMAKTELIKEYNLAGGFIWDLMRDNPAGFVTINSLLKIL